MGSDAKDRVGEGESFLEGKLLIAMPGMADERFAQTVIYICAHSAKGTMGLVINKPIPGLSFNEVMTQLEIPVSDAAPKLPILYGGPVESGRGFVLHSDDYESDDATLPVANDISLTATVEILRAMAEGRGPKKALFVLGYAGWAPGQVESEFHGNGWLHCNADPALIFDPHIENKWQVALSKLGVHPSGLVSAAGRA